MSRGMGKVQRAVLGQLSDGQLQDAINIAANLHGREVVTQSEAVSVRRALRGLEKAGLVTCLGHGWRDGRKRWGLPEAARTYQARIEAVFGKK